MKFQRNLEYIRNDRLRYFVVLLVYYTDQGIITSIHVVRENTLTCVYRRDIHPSGTRPVSSGGFYHLLCGVVYAEQEADA